MTVERGDRTTNDLGRVPMVEAGRFPTDALAVRPTNSSVWSELDRAAEPPMVTPPEVPVLLREAFTATTWTTPVATRVPLESGT